MTPQGVEHYSHILLLLSCHPVPITMTPQGVEHAIEIAVANFLSGVPITMTPQGVEHLESRRAEYITYGSADHDDAARR